MLGFRVGTFGFVVSCTKEKKSKEERGTKTHEENSVGRCGIFLGLLGLSSC